MRTFWLISGCLLAMFALERPAAAQTMVEYGAAGSAAANGAAGAKGVGSGIAGALDSLGKTLNQAQEQGPKAETVTKVRSKTAVPFKPKGPAAPPPVYEDATGIQKGMSCEDVTHRFGPPAMSFAGEEDSTTMSYTSKSGGVQVECQKGKVSSVDKPV